VDTNLSASQQENVAAGNPGADFELTLYRVCPLCDSEAIAEVVRVECTGHETFQHGIPPVVVWMRCQGCKHIFRNGYFGEAALRAVIRKTMRVQTVGSNYEAARVQVERTIDLVLPFAGTGVWLDVGFGDGALLRTVKEFGFTPLGIDLREGNAVALRRLGIAAYCADIQNFSVEPGCRVLSMQYVLAHMPFPRAALVAARRLLEEDAVLVIATPNVESSLWIEWDRERKNPYWGEIECCHHFSKTRLYELLGEHGFAPVRYALGLRYRGCMEVVARKV
jgi:SAM-dependent methyltransferase